MTKKPKSSTGRITACAMLTALGTVILAVGGLFQNLDLSAAALATVLCIYAVIELGGSAPWLIWMATCFLSLILLPQKSPAFFYLLIGFYPMVKEKLEKRSVPVMLLGKSALFAVLLVGVWLIIRIFFPADAQFSSGLMLAVLAVLGYLTLWVYDYSLTKLITLYLLRLREKFNRRRH